MSAERKDRKGVQDQVRTLIRRAHELVEGVDRDTFNRRPDPESWSMAECLDHLNETARLYLPVLAEAIEKARADGRLAQPGSSERTWLGRFMVWTQEPPVRLSMKTFEAIEPDRDHDLDDVLEAFEALHEELVVRINEAADLDRKRIKVRSVLNRRLTLSLGDWFHFMAAHARRHLWQAAQVKDRLEAEAGGAR